MKTVKSKYKSFEEYLDDMPMYGTINNMYSDLEADPPKPSKLAGWFKQFCIFIGITRA